MKRAILVFILIISNSFLFCQISQDSLGGNYIYPQFYENFSAEESWQIHKEAYIKQLGAKGLTIKEMEKKIAAYEKQKKEFIENIEKQRKIAAIQRKKADEQRKQAEILRQQAKEQREQADILRKQAEEMRSQNALQRQKAEEQRKRAFIQRNKAKKLRAEAEEKRKQAEEWKNSFENIFSKQIIISNQTSTNKPIVIKVEKRSSLLFNIKGNVSSGSAQIEIFKPSGKKEGELILEHKKLKSKTIEKDELLNSTSGSLSKTISNSETGDWQIKITTKNSEGTINISVAEYKKPVLDE